MQAAPSELSYGAPLSGFPVATAPPAMQRLGSGPGGRRGGGPPRAAAHLHLASERERKLALSSALARQQLSQGAMLQTRAEETKRWDQAGACAAGW